MFRQRSEIITRCDDKTADRVVGLPASRQGRADDWLPNACSFTWFSRRFVDRLETNGYSNRDTVRQF